MNRRQFDTVRPPKARDFFLSEDEGFWPPTNGGVSFHGQWVSLPGTAWVRPMSLSSGSR